MQVAVIRFPGSNCDDDVLHVLRHAVPGVQARFVFHKETELGACDAVVLPGGFSYGDYLRAGAMAAHSPALAAVRRFAAAGGPVLGICNGFQILCEAGLLEGALVRNASLHFECRDVHVVVEGRPTPWTGAIPAGRILKMPIAHAEGRYLHPEVERLEAEGRVVFRYVDDSGGETEAANPNGSLRNIAGVTNAAGNVVGLMPHPERAAERVLGGTDGRMVFESLLSGREGRPLRV
ncbi:MAG TPA: phosphoribosylformylglycinamidine synthase subunit PurQ [Polyangia bacterium]|jgi:phosphoribosylformylglycinamidine synthase|nr:phosphoribosylformylglycinamidine synthase subunit PurQ [Polyangia bacterium]